jgi:DNA-binding NtrC family response regulator
MKDNKRVLLVDDEVEFVETLAERLRTRDLAVYVANSGEEALEAVDERTYDAILLDLAMPGMNGLEALEKIRQIRPEAQVIVLTGRATVKDGVKAMKLGALDLLEKPVDITELVLRIETAATEKMRLTAERLNREMKEIMRKRSW